MVFKSSASAYWEAGVSPRRPNHPCIQCIHSLAEAFSQIASLYSAPAVSIEHLLQRLDGGKIRHTVQMEGWPFPGLWHQASNFPSTRWDAPPFLAAAYYQETPP